MSEDEDLEKLKAKRLEEMQRNISLQKKQKEQNSKLNEKQQKKSSPREIVVKTLGHRGLEVLENAEYQFPNETKLLIEKLAELITLGEINEILDGGKLLTLFRAIGISVRMETKMLIEKLAELITLGEINEILDGGKLLTLFRAIGVNVRMDTKISVEHDGKFVSLSDKLSSKFSDTNQENK